MSGQDRLAATVGVLKDLIAFNTVSTEPNRALVDYAAACLAAAGARVEVLPDETGLKANLFATLGPEGDGGIVLSGHTDTVPADAAEWTSDPFVLREAGARLFGRGSCDMKGFIAACLATAPDFAAAGLARPLHFAFTHDEETGCFGARRLVEWLRRTGRRPALAIIGEPTEMKIIEGHKGCCEYRTEFTGREGHASRPELGVNAIEAALHYAARLYGLAEGFRAAPLAGSRFEPPFTTLQIGRIEGGTARNVIARACTLDWEMRPVRVADFAAVHAALDACVKDELLPVMRRVAPEAGVRTLTVGEVAGLEPAAANAARDLVAALTGANGAGVVSFGTEAGLFQELGMDAVVCGPGSIAEAHKPDEWIAREQLAACLDMLAGLSRRLATGA